MCHELCPDPPDPVHTDERKHVYLRASYHCLQNWSRLRAQRSQKWSLICKTFSARLLNGFTLSLLSFTILFICHMMFYQATCIAGGQYSSSSWCFQRTVCSLPFCDCHHTSWNTSRLLSHSDICSLVWQIDYARLYITLSYAVLDVGISFFFKSTSKRARYWPVLVLVSVSMHP